MRAAEGFKVLAGVLIVLGVTAAVGLAERCIPGAIAGAAVLTLGAVILRRAELLEEKREKEELYNEREVLRKGRKV